MWLSMALYEICADICMMSAHLLALSLSFMYLIHAKLHIDASPLHIYNFQNISNVLIFISLIIIKYYYWIISLLFNEYLIILIKWHMTNNYYSYFNLCNEYWLKLKKQIFSLFKGSYVTAGCFLCLANKSGYKM